MISPRRTSEITTLTLLSLLMGCVGCSQNPVGPGGPGGPTGRIFFQWRPEGAPGQQPWVYDVRTGDLERVPIWFPRGVHPHVDTAGRFLAFQAPTADLTLVSTTDTTQLTTWGGEMKLRSSYPRLSQDGRYIATHQQQPFSSEIHVLDRTTNQVERVAVFDDLDAARPIHWFAGGDSLLIQGFLGSGIQDLRVVQRDGSRTSPFTFIAAHQAGSVAITYDGERIAIARPVEPGSSYDDADPRRIVIYDLRRGAFIRGFDLPHNTGAIAWSPDGGFLVHAPFVHVDRQSTLELLDPASGERARLVSVIHENAYAQFPTWTR
jgi:Tol biopolymer transport system component